MSKTANSKAKLDDRAFQSIIKENSFIDSKNIMTCLSFLKSTIPYPESQPPDISKRDNVLQLFQLKSIDCHVPNRNNES